MPHKHFPSSMYYKLIDKKESTWTYTLMTLWMHTMHTVYVPIYYTHRVNTGVQIQLSLRKHCPSLSACQAYWRRITLSCTVASQIVTCSYDSHMAHATVVLVQYNTIQQCHRCRTKMTDEWVRYHGQWYRRQLIDGESRDVKFWWVYGVNKVIMYVSRAVSVGWCLQ